MSYSQNLRTDTKIQTADNYFNNLYDQNVTTKFLNNKTTGRKTVIEGVANIGDVLTIISPSSGDWKDPDVARWEPAGGGGTMSDFTLQTTNPIKVNAINSTLVENADVITLSLAPSPGVGTYANPVSISVTNEGLVSNVVSGSAPVVPLVKDIIPSSNFVVTGNSEVYGPNATDMNIELSNTGVVANSYTNANISVDQFGRLTSASNGVAPVIPLSKNINVSPSFVATGNDSFYADNNVDLDIDLVDRFVGIQTYGDSTHIPEVTFNEKGVIVAAANLSISYPPSSVTINTTTPIAGGGTGNTFTLSHANSTVIPGAYGAPGSALVPVITCDSRGHITAATQGALPSQAVAGDGIAITGGGSVIGVNPGITLSHANFGTAGTYGSSTQVPVFSTNASGHVTGVVNTPITFPADTSLNSIATRNWKAGSSTTVGASDNVVVGDSAQSTSIRTVVVGSQSTSTGPGDNNIIGYSSTSSGTNNNIIGNTSSSSANNANVIGNGITNNTANTSIIGSTSAGHIVNSTGYFRSTNQYSSQATNAVNTVYGAFPATLTITPANLDWNFTGGVGVASNSLLLNDPDTLFHVEANVQFSITPTSGAPTQHQFQARLRYINNVSPAVNITTQSQFYYSTNLLTFVMAFSISGYIRTPSVIGAGQFAFVDIFRNTSPVASITCNNYRITMTRVA